jgi:hypothetical protein
MAKKKIAISKTKRSTLVDLAPVNETKRITFSTVETQHDIQLKFSMNIKPVERLKLMRKLNDYAFKNSIPEKIIMNPTKLIFSSYEYVK